MKTIHRSLPEGDILKIHMQSHDATCMLCNAETDYNWSIPTFNGDIVSNEFPDWLWTTSGGGQAVCESCYEKHARGEIETFDRYYRHLMGDFADGAGI